MSYWRNCRNVPTKTLSALLGKLADLGELSRLLSVFAARNFSECPLKELLSLVNQTAGTGVHLPRPEDAIEVALYLGLLSKRANMFGITNIGQSFAKHTSGTINKVSAGQAKLLIGLFVDDSELDAHVRRLFVLFQPERNGELTLHAAST